MSKNVAIVEGGVARTLSNVSRLEMDLQGGGTAIFVPEDEYDGITKYVSENGTYVAVDEGHYAYTEVDVSIPGSAGNIPGGIGCSIVGLDSNGDEWIVSVGDDGELEDTRPPVRIEIITLPYKLTYDDGEMIDITGMVVGAYDAGDNLVMYIPLEELQFTPNKADGSLVSTVHSATSDLTDTPILFSRGYCHFNWGGVFPQTFDMTPGAVAIITQSVSGGRIGVAIGAKTEDEISFTSDQYTHNGKTVYWEGHGYTGGSAEDATPPVQDLGIGTGPALWTALYGDIDESGELTVTVIWQRHGDYKLLWDQFKVMVNPESSSSTPGGGGGEFSGGGGGGQGDNGGGGAF